MLIYNAYLHGHFTLNDISTINLDILDLELKQKILYH